jgi:heme A synthase
MGEGLSGIHEMLGGIVVVLMVIVAILAAISAGGGSNGMLRPASMLAAGLYLLQIILGVLLIGGGTRNSTGHYLVGLLILVPVALQHSSARRFQARSRDYATMICALAAAFLSVLAYASGAFGILGPA